MQTAVVIEDDADVRSIVTLILSECGFSVHECERGLEGVEAVRAFSPDLVTLDLGLTDVDGFEVAKRIRQFSDTRILMLTARSHEVDTLMGLESGADDFVIKPVGPRELKLRVNALMRRPRRPDYAGTGPRRGKQAVALNVLEHNGLRLSVRTRTAERDGVELPLTPSEFDILRALMEGGRNVLSRADLAAVVQGGFSTATRGHRQDPASRIIPNHIGNLRKKLGESRADPRWIETVHGFGYRMTRSQKGTPAGTG